MAPRSRFKQSRVLNMQRDTFENFYQIHCQKLSGVVPVRLKNRFFSNSERQKTVFGKQETSQSRKAHKKTLQVRKTLFPSRKRFKSEGEYPLTALKNFQTSRTVPKKTEIFSTIVEKRNQKKPKRSPLRLGKWFFLTENFKKLKIVQKSWSEFFP